MTTKTIKSAGGDYTSLASAFAGEAATADDLTFIVFGLDIGAGDSGAASMAAFSITIQADPSARHAGVVPGSVLPFARTSGLIATDRTATVTGLLVTGTGQISVGSTDGVCTIDSCVFMNSSSSRHSLRDNDAGSTYFMVNCAFYGSASSGIIAAAVTNNCDLTVFVQQCSYASTGGITCTVDNSGGVATLNVFCENTAGFGAQAFHKSIAGSFLQMDGCAGVTGGNSEADSSSGFLATTAAANYTNTTSDARLLNNAPMFNAGNDFGIVVDIIGTHRPQGLNPDIGAFETIVASTNRSPMIRSHRVF